MVDTEAKDNVAKDIEMREPSAKDNGEDGSKHL